MSTDSFGIDAPRFWSTVMRSGEIGPGKAGGLRRLALTDADKEMRDLFVTWCTEAGCTVAIDRVGNIFARRPGVDDHLPPVLMGSHLDTQVAGGKYDGIVGVLAGLEPMLRSFPWKPGYGYSWAGEREETEKSFRNLAVAAILSCGRGTTDKDAEQAVEAVRGQAKPKLQVKPRLNRNLRGAQADDRARQAEDGGQRQRQRTHQQCNPDMGRSEPHRLALHRAGQAHAERLHRELQRPPAG